MRILLYGGNWISNIGNAFLDYGCLAQLKMAFPDAEIINGSKFPQSTLLKKQKFLQSLELSKNSFKSKIKSFKNAILGFIPSQSYYEATIPYFLTQDFTNYADYVIIHGTCLGASFLKIHYKVLKKLVDEGIKLIAIGGGMGETTYSNPKEINEVKTILKQLNPYLLISRDEETYQTFHMDFKHAYNGIDCAWFLDKYFKPHKNPNADYIAFCFDQKEEIKLKNSIKKIIHAHHDIWNFYSDNAYWGSKTRKKIKSQLIKPNTLISELPDDYLNLYANAKETHTDRVHACVASLIFNTPARLYSNSPRKQLFDRIGLENVNKELVELDRNKLDNLISKQIEFLRQIL